MISPLEIYVVLQMDSIKEALPFVVAASGISALGCVFVGSIGATPEIYDTDNQRDAKIVLKAAAFKWAKRLLVVCSLSTSMASLLPSTKTLAAMFIIPAVMNNETVQKEAGEIYTMAKDALKEAVKPEETK